MYPLYQWFYNNFSLYVEWFNWLVPLLADELNGGNVFPVSCPGGESLPIGPDAPVKVVLEEDGTIVEDEIYFLCLPSNTKFMLLGPQQMWCPVRRSNPPSLNLYCTVGPVDRSSSSSSSLPPLLCPTHAVPVAVDGGTSWMNRDSMLLEVDAVDGSISQVEPWWLLAQQLKQNMSSIITMSETDLQVTSSY